ncbi:MAG: TetR family transcriptional regulator [Rhizobiales bacterium]|nr:TetR family transcriptional regulator [Hyphomicrobiales bacterium]
MAGRPRGRPKSYNPDLALWQALETFWSSGFAATSLDDLSAATAMNRPSLYAAFGDKKTLYLKTLQRFASEMEKSLAGDLGKAGSLSDTLRAFYGGAIELYLSGPEGPRGCYVICTAPTAAATDADIRQALAAILKEIDASLEARISCAVAEGELSQEADPAMLARLAASVLHSIAVRARAGESRDALQSLAEGAVQLICQPHPPASKR